MERCRDEGRWVIDLKTQGMIWWLQLPGFLFCLIYTKLGAEKTGNPEILPGAKKKKKIPNQSFLSKDQKRGSIAIQNYFSMIIVLLQTNIIEILWPNPLTNKLKSLIFKMHTWGEGELATFLEFLLLLLLPKYFALWYWNLSDYFLIDWFNKKTSKKTSADRSCEKGWI